jgi:hypothetical protein
MASFVFTQYICERPILISIYGAQSSLPEKYHKVYEKMPDFRWFLIAATLDDQQEDRVREWAMGSGDDDLLSLLNDLCETVEAEFLGVRPGWIENLISRRDNRDN